MINRIIEMAKGYCEDTSMTIDADTSIVMDLELSSMSIFELVGDIEKEFGVRLSERALHQVDTLGDLCEVVKKLK